MTSRIHEEPGHEEDADAHQGDGQVGEDDRVDGADIAAHGLDGRRLERDENKMLILNYNLDGV